MRALFHVKAYHQYQIGPDGICYAVSGEVSIDASKVPDNPEATIRKMQVVQMAALAPVRPSPQDRIVAAKAAREMVQARQELSRKKAEESEQALGQSEDIPTELLPN